MSVERPAPGPTRLLFAADIHLGRQPARIPEDLARDGGLARLSPAAAWFRLVAEGLEQGVDAVVLAGDVVEQSDDFYEAYADLRAGVERLVAAGIRVVAVAGNHDVKVLPRLARQVDGFELLGAGGRWESLRVGSSGPELTLLGWSFTEAQASASPLAHPMPRRSTAATIGVLHCDRDAVASRYAPVRSSELQAVDVDAWLLGHVHKPDQLAGPRPIGYLGSLSAVDPGERGARGAWLLQVDEAGAVTIELLPLAPLRWEELVVSVSRLDEPDDVHPRIVEAIDRLHRRLHGSPRTPEAVGLRLRLTGRNGHGEALHRALHSADPRGVLQRFDDTTYFVHDWLLECRPALDLEDLARAADPAGLLAARLLVLRSPESAERAELLRAARRRVESLRGQRYYDALALEPPSDEEVARLLESAAVRALDTLLSQKAGEN